MFKYNTFHINIMRLKQLKEIIRTHNGELSKRKLKAYMQWVTDDGTLKVKAIEVYERDLQSYIYDMFAFHTNKSTMIIKIYQRMDTDSDRFFGNGAKKEGVLVLSKLLNRDALYVFYAQRMCRPKLLESAKSLTPLHDKLCQSDNDIFSLIDVLLQLIGKIRLSNNTISNRLWNEGFVPNFTILNKNTQKEPTEHEIVEFVLKYNGIDIKELKKEKSIKRK